MGFGIGLRFGFGFGLGFAWSTELCSAAIEPPPWSKGVQQAAQHTEPSSEPAAHTPCDAQPQLQSLAV